MNRNAMRGAAVAAAVWSLFAAGAAAAGDKTRDAADKEKEAPKTVQCSGINACKGQGACGGATHGCAGTNACKGQGWIDVKSEKECTDRGGKVIKS